MQAVTLTDATPGVTQFNLSFTNSNVTPTTSGPVTITYQHSPADLTNIAAALNGLASVQAAGGVVSVTQGPVLAGSLPGTYDPTFYVTFGGNMTGFNQLALTSTTPGLVVTTGGQLISLSGATANITSFTLAFGARFRRRSPTPAPRPTAPPLLPRSMPSARSAAWAEWSA